MKQVYKIALLLLAASIMAVIAGCSGGKPAKEAMLEALNNNAEADSYHIFMDIDFDQLDWTPGASIQPNTLVAKAMLGMLKDATINIDGVYRKDPLRMDIDMAIVFPESMGGLQLNVPMIMTKEALYVKLPQIPLLQLPETITGQYLKLDLQQADSSAAANPAAVRKLSREMTNLLIEALDDKTYFSEPKAADSGLSEDVKADRIVRLAVNADNYDKTVNTLVNDTLPKLIDVLLANEDELPILKLEKAEVEKLKTDMDATKTKTLDVLSNNIKLDMLQVTGAIQDGYLTNEIIDLAVKASDSKSGQQLNVDAQMKVSYSEINQKPEFKNELPAETITLEQLKQLFQSPVGL